jgi:hypothetical protein
MVTKLKSAVFEGFTHSSVEDVGAALRLSENLPEPWNGRITLHRLRVTVEVVEEPQEILASRLVDLWETTPYNHHHTEYFRQKAKDLGFELDSKTRGSKAKKR